MNQNRSNSVTDINRLLASLRSNIEGEFTDLRRRHPRDVRLALNEAEAIAWQSGLAHLVFPALAVEKLDAVSAWHERQREIQRREPSLAFAE